jgi:hypothetical protein
VPPGGGPPPDVHERTDETFYVVNGELEFLDGHRRFTASTGAVVFLPRGNVHRFYNPGIQLAKLGFIYTPCGAEGRFAEGGDKREPGVQVQPWGPERIDERMNALLARYDTGLPPHQSINTRGWTDLDTRIVAERGTPRSSTGARSLVHLSWIIAYRPLVGTAIAVGLPVVPAWWFDHTPRTAARSAGVRLWSNCDSAQNIDQYRSHEMLRVRHLRPADSGVPITP